MDAEAASCKELVLGGHSNRTTFAVDWFACNLCSVQYVKYIKIQYYGSYLHRGPYFPPGCGSLILESSCKKDPSPSVRMKQVFMRCLES